ncbi:HD-GYP domain-containing protein [Uliginosibacterium sediminicola]|uniref:HD domain-containing phosphohydrolase n=1 Tax=Uliginosibacterium sediminicola TaxID=2024550 RepID=A0ABU9YYU5_9RHOO
MEKELHRLQADQLHLNDALPWDVLDLSGTLLLSKGNVVRSEAQLNELLARGMFVDAAEYQASRQSSAPREKVYDPIYLMESVQAHLAWLLEALPRDGSFAGDVRNQAQQVAVLAKKSPDLALASIQLMEHRNYPIAHSFHVAVLVELLAARAGWPQAERERLCCAALTMNVGMLQLQLSLRNQRESPNAAQREQIRNHPAESARILMQCGVEDREWLRAVLEHHETLDGTGYPRKVKNPSELAQLIRVCDVFSAKISPRAYRKPVLASEATRILFAQQGQDPSSPWPGMLIKELGIYPPGTIVKLVNGEVAVVYKRGATAKAPLVKTLINAKGLATIDPFQRNCAEADFAIAAVMRPDKSLVGLDFKQIWCKP